MSKGLDSYRAKRNFSKTPEPSGEKPAKKKRKGNSYLIQKHAARRMHYDFRLEMDGVLKSWAVPEGPSLIPNKKRLAVHVEDHPLDYGSFEGVIPEGEYGAGTVMVWDEGTWEPDFDPKFGYQKGHLKFHLNGKKLKGQWHLVRMAPKPHEKKEMWLLFKSDDEAARAADEPDILELARSATSGRSMDEIAADHDRIWSSRGGGEVKVGKAKRKRAEKNPVDPADLPKAKTGAMPKFIEPSLPTAVEKAPSAADWVHEIKYDGYRVQARIENGKAKLLTRNGLDWTERFGGIGKAVASLPVTSAIVDGEVVVHTEAGVASFSALVDALKGGAGNLVFYGFDLMHLDGFDLRDTPLKDRKAALQKIIAAHGDDSRLRFSEHIEGEGETIFQHAGRLGLEGIVSKRISSGYQSGRTNTWVKVKCADRDLFVIAGYIPSTASKRAIGSLVLAQHKSGKLVASGHVGSGFSAADAHELWRTLDALRVKDAPIEDENAISKGAKWIEPRLVAEIEFRGRTGSDVIRHATFRELVDVDPKTVKRDATKASTSKPEPEAPTVKLTNPARLLWPDQGVTKQGLVDFYTEIADWILPHIAGRPLSLVRCPGGVQEQCFFQKHRWAGLSDAVRSVPIPGEDEPMIAIDNLSDLLELVQASVLEIHPWGARADRPEQPDRVTIDLDPGDDVPWEQTIEAALEVRTRLADLKLESFVKTTGGKGLHVVFPLTPKADWDTIKAFAQSIAEQMAADTPRHYTANMAKKQRGGRIFVDYLRNGRGATAVAAYSTRAKPGAAVSTPLAWSELGPGIRSNHFNVENLPKRLPFLEGDPWEGMTSLRQTLPPTAKSTPRTVTPRAAPAKTPALSDKNIQQLLPDAVAPSREALVEYWKKVAKDALPHLAERPLRLVRRVEGKIFYHQGALPDLPDAVHRLTIEKSTGGEGVRLWIDSVDGLLGLVALDVVEVHTWGSTIEDIERPDMLAFVLEPDDRVDWKFVTDTALLMRDVLQEQGLDTWPKLTGTGVHVMAPIEPDLDWDEARAYAKSLAEAMAATAPDRYVISPAQDKRRGRLYLNWRCNARGNTTIGAYSPCALPGFPVAAPTTWRALERGTQPDAFTMKKPPRR
jgi:bifunctional non-homologous end joining protein LigD